MSIQRLKRLADPIRPKLRPSFLVIGAQKAGTSALFKLLAAHPSILAPEVKELHFFDRAKEYERGPAHYLKQFPLRPFRERGMITFEATPNYLFQEAAAARIHATLPDIKLIAILREPVGRAFSAWNMYHQFQHHPRYSALHDPRSFEQAVVDELNGRTRLDPHLYLARGRYAPLLRRYFDLFGRERLLLLKHKDLDTDPKGVLDRCCTFLGLDPFVAEERVLAVRDNVRPYKGGMDPALQERLQAHFAPYLRELVELLGDEWDLARRP